VVTGRTDDVLQVDVADVALHHFEPKIPDEGFASVLLEVAADSKLSFEGELRLLRKRVDHIEVIVAFDDAEHELGHQAHHRHEEDELQLQLHALLGEVFDQNRLDGKDVLRALH